MSDFRKLVEAMSRGEELEEATPKGWEKTVKSMKDDPDVDNPYALAWHMKKKGYKPGGKKSKKESANIVGKSVEHPVKGRGVVIGLNEDSVSVRWNNLEKRLMGVDRFTFEDAGNYLTLEQEYTDDPEDASVIKKTKKTKNNKTRTDEAWMSDIPFTVRTTNYNFDSDNFDLTLEDIGLYEEDGQGVVPGVPRPSDTVLTKQSEYKSDSDEPLSTEEGDGDDLDYGVHEEDDMPDDAPDVPGYKEMEDQPESGNRRGSNRPGHRKKKKQNTETDDMDEKVNEGFGISDLDVEGILTEGYHGRATEMNYHDMDDDMEEAYGSGIAEKHDVSTEVGLSRELALDLFMSISEQSPDDEMIKMIVDSVIKCGEQMDRTLDVGDKPEIMSKIKMMKSGEMENEDKAEGDGEPAGPEAGEEHKGKTKLMTNGEDDYMEDDDEEVRMIARRSGIDEYWKK